MRIHFSILFLAIGFNLSAQWHYTDTLPKMEASSEIYLDANVVNRQIGLTYEYHFINGTGYRNFQGAGIGFKADFFLISILTKEDMVMISNYLIVTEYPIHI
ncbi:MAG: hypothetical protein MK078_07615 [Crocinitomicaceae bacterium]|nr:hypothetical protein [Crocinitomicaceae bacterium]